MHDTGEIEITWLRKISEWSRYCCNCNRLNNSIPIGSEYCMIVALLFGLSQHHTIDFTLYVYVIYCWFHLLFVYVITTDIIAYNVYIHLTLALSLYADVICDDNHLFRLCHLLLVRLHDLSILHIVSSNQGNIMIRTKESISLSVKSGLISPRYKILQSSETKRSYQLSYSDNSQPNLETITQSEKSLAVW